MSDDEATADNERRPAVGAPVEPSVRPLPADDKSCPVLEALKKVEAAEGMDGSGQSRGWFALRQSALVLAREVRQLRAEYSLLLQKHNALHLNAKTSRDSVRRLQAALDALVNALDSGHSLSIADAWAGAEAVLRPNVGIEARR